MSEFEKARQEIARAESSAQRMKEEAETIRKREQEEKVRKDRERLAIIACHEGTFSRISPEVIVILQRINAELFGNQGSISRWHKARKTYIHSWEYEDFGSDFSSPLETRTGYQKMCTSRMEASLRIPNLGNVTVYFPLETREQAPTYYHLINVKDEKGDWKEWETERDRICIESDSVAVGDYQDNAEIINFNQADEEILKQIQKTILKACVNMRKKSLGLKYDA